MSDKKYEFTGLEKVNLWGYTVKQIRALVDIPGAAELAEVLFALLRQVNELQEKTPDIYYSALGSGIVFA